MMRKKHPFILLISIVLVTVHSSAQVVVPELDEWLSTVGFKQSIEDELNPDIYGQVKGSPYLSEDFVKGEVMMRNGDKYQGILRYDLYANEIQFKVREMIYVIAFPQEIESLTIGNVKLVYAGYIIDRKLNHSYFEQLTSGPCELLTKKQVLLKDAVPAKPYVEAQPARFKLQKDVYYLKKGDIPAMKIGKKSEVIEFLNEGDYPIADFIKKEKINLNQKEDLLKLVEYYNISRIEETIENP